MHAATALLAALVEGTAFSGPVASTGVKTAILTLLKRCLEDLSAMPLPLVIMFTVRKSGKISPINCHPEFHAFYVHPLE